MDATTLTGVWAGTYAYPHGHIPVTFTATLVDWGGGLSGACEERSADEWGHVRIRGASFEGTRAGADVRLTKTYDGAAGWGHAVAYAGVLTADGCAIEGTWSIPGVWSGPFVMRRERQAERAAPRRAVVEA